MENNFRDVKVLMFKEDTSVYPKYNLPDGFFLSKYKDGFEKYWAEIHVKLDQFKSYEDAVKCFEDTFFDGSDNIYKKCLFILNSDGIPVATASLWDGNHFGKTLQRIHWVAVSPDYQGYGLAKTLVSKVLDLYNGLGFEGFIYLTSQVSSYKALNIYSKFGFIPYLGEKPENWVDCDFKKDTEYAWKAVENLCCKKFLI